jgi:predicted ATPase with chaperone activity
MEKTQTKKFKQKGTKFLIVYELPYDITQDVLNNYEQLFMDCYRNCGIKLLNEKEAGSHGKHSDRTKKKISNGLKKRQEKIREEHRKELEEKEKLRTPESDRKGVEELIIQMKNQMELGNMYRIKQELEKTFKKEYPNEIQKLLFIEAIEDRFYDFEFIISNISFLVRSSRHFCTIIKFEKLNKSQTIKEFI